ncbi:MAG: hypothetical protein RBR53_11515 [Desulforegulaceae bacterium]|nr:hypothetical protein [Desulforegulaceae bacterium]
MFDKKMFEPVEIGRGVFWTGFVDESVLKSGFKDMFYDGIKKVLRGLTTIEELERVVGKS